MKRTPLRRRLRLTGPRRRTGPMLAVRLTVLHRDDYRCVIGGEGSDLQIHHRRPRGAGGSSLATTNMPSNLITLCAEHHAWVESRREEARDHGWLVSRYDNPLTVPVAHHLHGHVLLLDDGRTAPVPHVDGAP